MKKTINSNSCPNNRFTFNFTKLSIIFVLLWNLEKCVAQPDLHRSPNIFAEKNARLQKLPSLSTEKVTRQRMVPSHRLEHVTRFRGGKVPWRISPTQPRAHGQQSSPTPTYPVVEDVTEEEREKSTTAAKETMSAFLSRDNRNSFIVRVYSILSVQLLFTAATIFAFHSFPGLTQWMTFKGRVVPMLSLLVSSITCMFMASSEQARRSSPLKWQLLSLFTVGQSIFVGFITSFYSFKTVLNAMMSTAVATLTVTMYTLLNPNPKYDLSQWGSGLVSAGVIFLVYGMINLLSQFGILPAGFLPYNEALYSLLGASLFSLYLAYHTRLVISGKHTKYQLNEKDYVFGAMALYSDIIDIFIYLLRLLDTD